METVSIHIAVLAEKALVAVLANGAGGFDGIAVGTGSDSLATQVNLDWTGSLSP